MIWPFKQVGPCVTCKWHRPGALEGVNYCAQPRVVLFFNPVDGKPAHCEVARAGGYHNGPCSSGRLYEAKEEPK